MDKNLATGGGAAVGAVIGFFVFNWIGAIAGAAVGGGVGYFVGSKTSKSNQSEAAPDRRVEGNTQRAVDKEVDERNAQLNRIRGQMQQIVENTGDEEFGEAVSTYCNDVQRVLANLREDPENTAFVELELQSIDSVEQSLTRLAKLIRQRVAGEQTDMALEASKKALVDSGQHFVEKLGGTMAFMDLAEMTAHLQASTAMTGGRRKAKTEPATAPVTSDSAEVSNEANADPEDGPEPQAQAQ